MYAFLNHHVVSNSFLELVPAPLPDLIRFQVFRQEGRVKNPVFEHTDTSLGWDTRRLLRAINCWCSSGFSWAL